MRDLEDHLLVPLLDATGAWVLESAPDELPTALRRLVGFDPRGLRGGPARKTLRRALDDASVRERATRAFCEDRAVVAAVEEFESSGPIEAVGRAAARGDLPLLVSALWARRPPGWEMGVGVAIARDHELRLADGETRSTRDLASRLAEVSEALRRADGARMAAEAQASQLTTELRDERGSRRAAVSEVESEMEDLRSKLAELDGALSEAREQIQAAELRTTGATKRARALQDDVARLRTERDESRAKLAESRARPERRTAMERDDIARLDDSIDAAQSLAGSLMAILERIAPERARARGAVGHEGEPQPLATEKAPRRRTRPDIASGLSMNTSEGLDSMLRTPDLILVVDGYNVSRTGWSDATPADQRERLARALDVLAQQSGASVVVVFDGDAEPSSRTMRGLRVVFSGVDEEADDVVIREIASLSNRIPVVVASSDAWVREHADELGAVVVPARLLLAAMHVGI